MNKISKTMTIVLFFGFLLLLPILTLLMPKQTVSEVENRTLAKTPDFSIQNVKDRTYMNGIESYLSDHFVGRPNWIGMKTDIELLTGKNEIKDVFILDNRLVKRTDAPDYSIVDGNVSAINQFANENNLPVFLMLAPTSSGIYMDELPANSGNFNQKGLIDYSYNNINSDIVTTLNAYSALYATRDEYIYYRTDHHWTSLGAYYAYSSTIKKMGFTPMALNRYDVEHASHSFKGTLYSDVLYDKIDDDVIDYYFNRTGTEVTSVISGIGDNATTSDSLYFREFLDKKDKYSSYTGPNQPFVTIKTNSTSDKKLLLFKDSYAHCLVPFLTQHYSEIVMIDLRYVTSSVDSLVDIDSFDHALFMYNTDNFSEDSSLTRVNFKTAK